jgi:Alpha-L-arabinofuranosidase C-terminal domain
MDGPLPQPRHPVASLHQLAVAERERPGAHSRLTWPDRAWLALLAGTMPAERLAAMRLIVTPGTILRWQRDFVRRRWDDCRAGAGPGARQRIARCGRWYCGLPGRTSHGDTAGSTANSREFRGFRPAKVLEHRVLADPDEDARNMAKHPHRVTPTSLRGMRITEGSAHVVLPPMSWNMIRFAYL